MSAIDAFNELERNELLKMQLVPMINKSAQALSNAGHETLASEWIRYSDILIHLVTHARQEVYIERQKRAYKAVHNRPD